MPRAPQTAVTALLQQVADTRDLAPGSVATVRPHLLILGPREGLAALRDLASRGISKITRPDRVLLCTEDALPARDKPSADARRELRERAEDAGITRLAAASGQEFLRAIESGDVAPGEVMAGSGPEIGLLGGYGALGLRATVSGLAEILAGQPLHLRVPEPVRVDLRGALDPFAEAADAIWALRRELGREKLAGRAIEFGGDGLAGLSIEQRAALCAGCAWHGVFTAYCIPDRRLVETFNR